MLLEEPQIKYLINNGKLVESWQESIIHIETKKKYFCFVNVVT